MGAFAARGDVRLWWESIGTPGPRNLLLHPGGGDTASVFPDTFVEHLARAYDFVIRFDPRDTGRSTRLPDEQGYDLDDLADDLWAVVDAAGVQRIALLGYSLGGPVVQRAAVRQPARVTELLLVATLARPGEMMISDQAMTELLTVPDGAGPDDPQTFLDMSLYMCGATDADLAEFGERMSSGRAPTTRSTERHTTATLAGPIPTDDELAGVAVPVHVVHSTDDLVLPHEQAEAIARPYPNARITRVHGIGHVPVERQWHEIAATLLGES